MTDDDHPFITSDWPALVEGESANNGEQVIRGGTLMLSLRSVRKDQDDFACR